MNGDPFEETGRRQYIYTHHHANQQKDDIQIDFFYGCVVTDLMGPDEQGTA